MLYGKCFAALRNSNERASKHMVVVSVIGAALCAKGQTDPLIYDAMIILMAMAYKDSVKIQAFHNRPEVGYLYAANGFSFGTKIFIIDQPIIYANAQIQNITKYPAGLPTKPKNVICVSAA